MHPPRYDALAASATFIAIYEAYLVPIPKPRDYAIGLYTRRV